LIEGLRRRGAARERKHSRILFYLSVLCRTRRVGGGKKKKKKNDGLPGSLVLANSTKSAERVRPTKTNRKKELPSPSFSKRVLEESGEKGGDVLRLLILRSFSDSAFLLVTRWIQSLRRGKTVVAPVSLIT